MPILLVEVVSTVEIVLEDLVFVLVLCLDGIDLVVVYLCLFN